MSKIHCWLLTAVLGIAVLSGCANQQVLATGVKYAEAYAKVGVPVDEALMLSRDAQRRRAITDKFGLVPSDESKDLSKRLGCISLGTGAAQSAFAAGNLSRYQDAIETLAKAPADSVAGVVAGLRKSLPTSDDVIKSFEDFRATENKRQGACLEFATISLSTPMEPAGFDAGESITAVFGILKRLLETIEKERRARAYVRLVQELDKPIVDNLTALDKELRLVLLRAAREGLVSGAIDLSPPSPASPAIALTVDSIATQRQKIESAMDSLARFDKAWGLYDGFYSASEGGDSVFNALIKAHNGIVAQARSGKVDGASAIDDLLAVLKLVSDINENLEKL